MADTRVGWQEIVTPDDLEGHMLDIGQVKANAALIDQMLAGLRAGTRIYVPGAGTGQIFDYMKSKWSSFDYIFSDLRLDFLDRIARRMPAKVKFRLAIDDVEDSTASFTCDIALVVLVLEHVEWKKALREILKTRPREMMIVIQRNHEVGTRVVAKRKLRPSIAEFAKVATAELVEATDLIGEMKKLGFQPTWQAEREVPDSKAMQAIRFTRVTAKL